jgi:hypothetical protein
MTTRKTPLAEEPVPEAADVAAVAVVDPNCDGAADDSRKRFGRSLAVSHRTIGR